ncbi:STAS domain-containing protein [Solirubrobacter taibaiensis]|nr:STAS domain-containing protein [Solirubrobacter taibaiensis]
MTIERHALLATAEIAESHGILLTQETFDPCGLVITVSGELDIATAPALRDLLEAAAEAGTDRLVIDLSAVSFLDSVALATILHAKQRLPRDGKIAVAIDPSSYAMLIFESGGLKHVLDLVDTRAQAIELVSS